MVQLPRILDPKRVPVTAVDSHLAPVRREALRPSALRRRLAQAHALAPELSGDGRLHLPVPARPAAVLVPLVRRRGGLHVLLTHRSAHLRDHAGQVSFPGGRCEDDDPHVEATALRETREEIGLDPRHVEVIGRLATYTTITNYVVTPVVGLVTPPFELMLDHTEVDEAFEVPLPFLMNPAHHRHHGIVLAGMTRQFLSMPWIDPEGGREHFIWGATAAMLRNLYRVLVE